MTKINRLIRTRLFVNENIILYKHARMIDHFSSAKIVKATKENINDVLNFQEKCYIIKFLDFLDSGDIGYLGYLGERCVHRSWVKQGPQKVKLHPLLHYILAEGDMLIHYCETAPKARGQHIYPHVLSTIVKEFDTKRILISTEAKNEPSINGILRAGFVEVRRFNVQALFGIKRITEQSPKASAVS